MLFVTTPWYYWWHYWSTLAPCGWWHNWLCPVMHLSIMWMMALLVMSNDALVHHVDDGTTGRHLPSSVEVWALLIVARTDVSSRLCYILWMSLMSISFLVFLSHYNLITFHSGTTRCTAILFYAVVGNCLCSIPMKCPNHCISSFSLYSMQMHIVIPIVLLMSGWFNLFKLVTSM